MAGTEVIVRQHQRLIGGGERMRITKQITSGDERN
jgi:hypothetical protein